MMAASSVTGRVLPAVWKLLRLRVRLSINSFRHSKLRSQIFTVIGVLALLAFAGALFYVSQLLLGLLRSPELAQYVDIDMRALLQSMPVLILTGLFFGVVFTSFGVLLQALYLTGDMDFLLSSPVPLRALFITKLMQAVLPNFGLFALFGLPILYGLGISGKYNFIYYPLTLLIIAALTLAAAGLSALLVMVVVRVLPPRRAAEILGFIGATAGVICSQVGNFSQSFGRDVGFSPTRLSGVLLPFMTRLRSLWFPLNWAGQGLVYLGEGHWLPGIVLIVLTLGLASLCFWFALATAERLYYTGWAGMQVVARKSRPNRASSWSTSTTTKSAWLEGLLPGPVRGMLVKDALVLRRDLRNLSQIISPLIVGITLSLTVLRTGGEPPPGRGEAPAWFLESFRALLALGSVWVSLFVGWILLGRLAGMSFSQEGKNFWMLKSSPVSSRQMLFAKFLGAYLPALALGWLFLISISLLQRILLGPLLYSLLVVALCLAGLSGILIGFGARGANFKWDDPRRMNAGGIGCLGQIVTMLFLPVSLGFFIGPLFLAAAFHFPQYYGYVAGLCLGTGVNILCSLLPLKVVEETVRRLDES